MLPSLGRAQLLHVNTSFVADPDIFQNSVVGPIGQTSLLHLDPLAGLRTSSTLAAYGHLQVSNTSVETLIASRVIVSSNASFSDALTINSP